MFSVNESDSQVRTAEQTEIALFWADGGGTYTPPGHWNEIANTATATAGKGILANARLFAQLNLALADAGIAAWDAKYTYNTWRPITAIRAADKDGNNSTTADPNWLPLIDTPPFPEYVSGHSTFSSAASTVLTRTFGNNFNFTTGSVGLPDVSRTYTSFESAALEAGQSRIYGGIHFQFANQDGLELGRQIGNYVVDRLLLDRSQSPLQVNLTQDTAAFGTLNRDRITSNPTLTGKINLDRTNSTLQIKDSSGNFVAINDAIDSNGNFQLDETKLTTLLGTLTDKTYQLEFRLVDNNNLVLATTNFNFTLDRSNPTASINPLDRLTPTGHITGTTSDNNGSTSGRFKLDNGNWTSFSVAADGKFDKVINPQGLSAGSYQITVEIADLAGNITSQVIAATVDNSNNIYVSPATNPGWGQLFTTGFTLAEGNSLIAQNTLDVQLGGSGKRTLEFDLTANFDRTDTRSTGKDRLAVYLVDNNNNKIALDNNQTAGVPLFSLSETGAEIIPGLVKFDGTHVSIDVSRVAATQGKLVMQLLNLDGDSGSKIGINNFNNSIDPNGTPGNSLPNPTKVVTPGTSAILDNYRATNNAQLLLGNVSVDKNTGKYTAQLRVQNIGNTTLSRNLAVLLADLPAGVTLNGSGTHPAGAPYLNFDTAIKTGGLAQGEISDAIAVEINDPNLIAFNFKPVVLQGALDAPPDLSSLRNLTVKVGDKIDVALLGLGNLAIKTDTKLPTGQITGDNHLIFKPAPEQIGTYNFTLVVKNGATETRQDITLNVIPDPVTTTRVSGVIADTNQAGLGGVLVELSGVQAVTDTQGKFTIVLPNGAAGDTLKIFGQRIQTGGITYPFIAEKMGLVLGHEIYQGVNNQIDRPIYLPLIDTLTGTTVNPGATTVVTNPNLVGAKVTVAANSLFDKNGNAFTGILSITEVPPSLTPAALPENLHPDMVVTIQPGDMVFNTPAQITLPNRAGYLPGLELDLWSINPNTGEFDNVGTMRVSADGSVIETISGGIRNSSWHFAAPQPPEIDLDTPNNADPDKTCQLTQPFKSEVSGFSGIVTDDLGLVTYQSQGITQGINLHYDSSRANPNQIVHTGGSGNSLSPTDVWTTKLTLQANGISQTVAGLNSSQLLGLNGGERVYSIPAGTDGKAIDTAIFFDTSHLATGAYEYRVDSGIRGLRSWQTAPGTFTVAMIGTTSTRTDKFVVVNDSNSVFGSGWNVSGLQKLVINADNSALLIDGGGSQQIFSAPIDSDGGNSSGFLQPRMSGAAVNTSVIESTFFSPEGDFSVLDKLKDGTFRRTLKDGTVYQFDRRGLMVAAIAPDGNKTQHIYNESGQIQQIVDPVGLTTTFNYTGNRVTSIVDPAGRITQLEYDPQGNLASVINPNGSKNQYGYDGGRRVTSHIDVTGQVKTGSYDEFGRAKTATREDGSTVTIAPVEVIGLRNQQATTNLQAPPPATIVEPVASSSYTDGNGNTVITQLDRQGKANGSSDAIGAMATTKRTNNLVTEAVDAKGNRIQYAYDSKGNVISSTELVESSILTDTSFSTNAQSVPVANNIYGLGVSAAGDLNNDGKVDLVSVDSGGNLNIVFGDITDPNATVTNLSTDPFVESEIINQLKIEDVDRDGIMDIIANLPIEPGGGGYGDNIIVGSSTSLQSDPVLVFLGLGNGQFDAADVLPLVAVSDGFVTGDFTGDGNLDILVRSDIYSASNNNVYPLVLFAGNGAGTFNETAISLPGINNQSYFSGGLQMVAADFDRDGRSEVVFNRNGKLSIYKYDTAGNWSEDYTYDYAASSIYYSYSPFTVGDVNGDGASDLVLANQLTGKVDVLLQQTGGGFSKKTFDYIDSSFEQYIANLDIVDIDGNGTDEIVLVDQYSRLKTFAWNNDSGLVRLSSYLDLGSISNEYLQYSGFVDTDGDRRLDLLASVSTYNSPTLGGRSFASASSYSDGVQQQFVVLKNTGAGNIYTALESKTKSYTYDAVFNQLTSTTDELGRKTLYDLDANTGKVIKTTRVVGQLDSTINGETNDVVSQYSYTSQGQLDLTIDALGRITDYDYDTYGNLVTMTAAKGTVAETVERYEYDLAGNRTAEIDALERRTTYTYDSMNMLLQSTDANGGKTTYTYDKMGHVTSMTDALGHVTKMVYDRRGRLSLTTDANGSETINTYDNNGNLVEVRSQKSGVRSEDLITNYQYDARNRLIKTTAADGGISTNTYDLNDNLVIATDSLQGSTQIFYDSRNRLSRSLDALGNETKYLYDAANQLVGTIDALGRASSYQYDDLGRMVAFRDALGNVTRTEYDKLGNVTATVDANGNRTEFTYDELNRRVAVRDAKGGITGVGYDKVGNVLTATDALNRTTSYVYDNLDRQIAMTDALGQTSSTSYDKVGNVLTTTDALNRTTSYSYDNLDRLTTTTDALGQSQSLTYDKLGNVLTATNEAGRVTSFTYDKSNRRTSTTDSLGNTTLTSYDTEGNITATTDAIGNQTTYQYDANNRQIKVTDAKGGKTYTTYDALGNVSTITDSVGNKTTYVYDAIDRLLTDTNQLGKTRTYSYDAVGNRVKTIDRNNRQTTYSYDELNRQTAENWIGINNQTQRTFSYVYDAVGHLLTSTDPDSKYTYTYDAIDRITSVDNTGTAGVPAVKFNYGYDNVGNLLTVNDTINGVSAGTTAYSYDRLNRVTTLTQSGNGVQNKRVDMAYNALNQLTNLNRFSNSNAVAQTEYIYDNNQRLIQLSHKKGSNTIASYDYGYDAANKLAQMVSSTDGTSNYSYDATNQLTGTDNSSRVDEAYSYDANGNRTNNGYVTGVNNQLLSDGKFNYLYDNEGNRTQRTEIATGKVTEYNWDYRNRLNSVVFKDASGVVVKTIEYSYDVDNQRIGKKIDGQVTERYVIDRNQIALVFDGAGNQTHRYLYGTQVDQILADETPTSMVWALADNQGTVRDLIDDTGSVVNHITYDSFGQVVSETNSSFDFRYGYTGREQDAETGLDYYRARYYDSAVGRFVSEDPIGFAAGDTNIYRYVGNSPTNFVDPSGLDGELNIPKILWDGLWWGTLGALGALGALLNQNSQSGDRDKTPPSTLPQDLPRAGYCNEEPPPDCEPSPGEELVKDITQEILQNLLNEATKFQEKGNKYDKTWGDNNNIAIGISESGKKYVASTIGSYGKGREKLEALAAKKGYIVVKTKGLGVSGWHAEGRLIQNGVNIGDRIIAIGVSDKMCESCAADIEKYNIKTANGKYKPGEYKDLPDNRPGQKRVRFDTRPKKKKC